MYCAWRIPAYLRSTQCSILLHLMYICFLTCICLWQISQIQTCLFKVVGPGLVSTSPAFVSSSANHPTCPHGRHAKKTVNRSPIAGGGKVHSTQVAQQLVSAVRAPPLVGCVVGGVLSPTFTLQTYHHPEDRFRSWPSQMTSHLHTQARVQTRNTYNHTYIQPYIHTTIHT